MSRLEQEIREQPGALARVLADERGQVAALARALDARTVMIAARGSSDNAARYAQYLLGERLYITLSLTAKSALAWQIFAGTLAA